MSPCGRHRWPFTALAAVAIGLGGCAGKVRELMPTPDLERLPGGQAIFSQVPEARRASDVDLLFITDRAPQTASEQAPEKGPQAAVPSLIHSWSRGRFFTPRHRAK